MKNITTFSVRSFLKSTSVLAGMIVAAHALSGVSLRSAFVFPRKEMSQSKGRHKTATETFVVEFKSKPSRSLLAKMPSLKPFTPYRSTYFDRVFETTTSMSANELETELVQRGFEIARLERVGDVEMLSLTPANDARPETNDPFFSYQWGLKSTGQVILRDIDDLNSERVIENPQRGSVDIGLKGLRARFASQVKRDMIVAVIDNGIDHLHPDLTKNILRNTAECDGDKLQQNPTKDNDGNGFVGDCMGWNFVDKDEAGVGNSNTAEDIVFGANGTSGTGHGTHVAGIIAAEIDNAIGISGVAPRLKILPLKVFGSSGKNKVGARIAKAVLYAVKMKADVINISAGWPTSQDTKFLREAFAEARKNGVVVVAAAGNNSSALPVYPCSYLDVICVGSVSIDASISQFSNYGGHVDILAPGEEILSTYPRSLTPRDFPGSGFDLKSGTSQASPFVAAGFAMLKGLLPQASRDELQARLALGAKSVEWRDRFALSGAMDLQRALDVRPQPFVQPVYKGIFEVPYVLRDKTFSFTLPIKNYWLAAPQVSIEIETDGSAISLDRKQFQASIASGETKTFRITGRILDVSGSRDSRLKVRVRTGNGAVSETSQNLVMTRRLESDPDVENRVISLSRPLNDLLLFNPVRDDDSYPDFVNFAFSGDDTAMTLVRTQDGWTYRDERAVKIPGKRVLTYFKYDADGDNKNDYFISSVGSITVDGKKESALYYTFLRHDLSPVFPGQPSLVVELEGGGLFDDEAQKTLNFMPIATELGAFRTMIFRNVGQAPNKDMNQNRLEFEQYVTRDRIYFYEPKKEAGVWKIYPRNLDNFEFEAKLRAASGVRARVDVGVAGILPQSPNDRKLGVLRLIAEFGESRLKSYKILVLRGENALMTRDFSMAEPNLGGQTFKDAVIKPVTVIGGANPSDSYSAAWTYYSGVSARLSLLGQRDNVTTMIASQKIVPARKQDNLLNINALDDSHLGTFVSRDQLTTFAQTKGQLVLRTTAINGSGDVYDQKPIDRNTMLPGTTFAAVHYPITRGRTGQAKLPSIFVDATQIFGRRIYLWTSSSDGRFFAPMRLNVEIPDHCVPQDPKRFGNDEFRYTLLCVSDQNGSAKFELKTLLVD